MTSNTYIQLRQQAGRPLFVPFTVIGDPNKEASIEIIRTLVDNGADALELGFPFSDPPADGPVIQAADVRALQSGMRTRDCFDVLKSVRTFTDVPIGLLVYLNLVLQFGIDAFYAQCTANGVQSVLIPDLPLEHANEYVAIAKKHGIAPVFLISELTTDDRMKQIAKIADGYLYLVSYLGITGVENAILEEKIHDNILLARKHSDLPILVGFGINSVEQAQASIRAGADGFIVGSRIVKEIPDVKKISKICDEMRLAI